MKCLARDVKVRSTMNHFGSSELHFYNSLIIVKRKDEKKKNIRDHNKDVNYMGHVKVFQEGMQRQLTRPMKYLLVISIWIQ